MAQSVRILATAAALVALAGCGGGGGERETKTPSTSAAADESSTTAEARSSTTSTSTTLAATDEESVAPELRELAERFDAAVEGILTDPRVAGDPDHPAVRAYLELFIPGSEFATGALEAWEQEGAAGRFFRPGPRGQMSESTVVDVALDGTDSATFTMCSITSVEIVDAAGQPVSGEGGRSAARAIAELAGTEWLLRELSEVSPEGCEPAPDEESAP